MSNEKFSYKITEHIATLATYGNTSKELNKVSYNGAAPKWDLRNWKRENGEEKLLKGITLSDEEVKILMSALAGAGL